MWISTTRKKQIPDKLSLVILFFLFHVHRFFSVFIPGQVCRNGFSHLELSSYRVGKAMWMLSISHVSECATLYFFLCWEKVSNSLHEITVADFQCEIMDTSIQIPHKR